MEMILFLTPTKNPFQDKQFNLYYRQKSANNVPEMRILLSADFHGDFTRLFQIAGKFDLCLCCGDIFDYHQLPTEDFAFPLPFYCIKGNKEVWGAEKLQEALMNCGNFHWLNPSREKLAELIGLNFYGIDYLHEPLSLPNSIDVLISHQPAFGLADQCCDPYYAKQVSHCGSQALRKLVDQYKPRMILAGHVHLYQKQQAGETFAITLQTALNDPLLMIEGNQLVINNEPGFIF